VLPGRQSLLLGTGDLAGEEATLRGPALLGARQFGVRRRLSIVGHVIRFLLSVPVHRRVMPGVAHGRIDQERQEDLPLR